MFSRRLYPDVVGGREIFVAGLIEQLAERGFEVDVLSESNRQWAHPSVNNLSTHHSDLPLVGFFIFAMSGIFAAIRRRQRIDVVHTHSSRYNVLLGGFISKLLGKAHVITVHCATTDAALRDYGTPGWYRGASYVIAISQAMLRAISEQLGIRTNVTLIPTTSPPARGVPNRTAIREKIGLSEGDKVIAFVGRLDPHKEPEVLLEALTAIGAAGLARLQLKAVFVGDGPSMESLTERVRQGGLSPFVRFTGMLPHEQGQHVLACSDVFVLPSRHEALGISVVEAMRASIPVVVADAEGLRDLVPNNERGFTFPIGDARALADKLVMLLSNSEVRLRLVRAARVYAESTFDLGSIVDRHARLYETISAPRQRS